MLYNNSKAVPNFVFLFVLVWPVDNDNVYLQILSVSQTGTLATFRNSIWYARSKWVLAQVLMLALNFGQYELVSTIRLYTVAIETVNCSFRDKF